MLLCVRLVLGCHCAALVATALAALCADLMAHLETKLDTASQSQLWSLPPRYYIDTTVHHRSPSVIPVPIALPSLPHADMVRALSPLI